MNKCPFKLNLAWNECILCRRFQNRREYYKNLSNFKTATENGARRELYKRRNDNLWIYALTTHTTEKILIYFLSSCGTLLSCNTLHSKLVALEYYDLPHDPWTFSLAALNVCNWLVVWMYHNIRPIQVQMESLYFKHLWKALVDGTIVVLVLLEFLTCISNWKYAIHKFLQ